MPGWVSIFFLWNWSRGQTAGTALKPAFLLFLFDCFLENSIYICIYIYNTLSIYIYIYTCHMYIYIYIYIYVCVPSKQVNDLDKVCYDRSLASSKKDSGNHPQMSRRFNQTRQGKNHGKSTIYWLVVSNMAGLLSISYMGCHPKPIDKNIFERGR